MTTKKQRHEFFNKLAQDYDSTAICIPDMAMRLDNNCKEGAWFLGETNYGNRLQVIAVKFSKRLHVGNEYTDPGNPMGQLWFVPVVGGIGSDEQGNEIQLPLNICYYTLIKNSKSGKSGSLINFGQKATLCQSQGYDFREVIWIPRFIKKSGMITNEAGQKESASWYVLDWSFIKPEEQATEQFNRVQKTIEILQSEDQMQRLFDPGLEKESRCVDGMTSAEIAALAQNLKLKALTGET